jgi:DNA-binding transcriptional MerR regulator
MTYRVGEFAALTGVTVRALQHYDRLGLLTPKRADSGHRIYAESDRQRVRHILALRAVGMSLQQIAKLLRGSPSRLAEEFRTQCARLEQSRTGIEEALRVLRQLDSSEGAAGESVLDRLAAAVEMQDACEAIRGYFSDAAWTRWAEPYFHDWPPAAWRALYRDVEAALGEDPESARAQELFDRATALWQMDMASDAELLRAVREGFGRLWKVRDSWPRELQRRYSEFRIDEIVRFLDAAAMASWRRRGLVETYTTRSIA